jgi:AcrR family transcriptional regulator
VTTNDERKTTRQQRILDAALSVFSRQGYHDAGVDEIATLADTSKGGLYFHFPGKQQLFLALLERSTKLLLARVQERIAAETDPIAKADAAILAVLQTFSGQRTLARLLLVEAMGAGAEFHTRMTEIHRRFAEFIAENLEEAVRQGVIPPVDTRVAGMAWFGALNQVVTTWLLADPSRTGPDDLEAAYPALRTLLLRSVGVVVDEIDA